MTIGILGTGDMSRALGVKWIKAGHEVCIAGRTASKAQALADEIGATTGSLAEAVAACDTLLLAVRSDGALETIEAAGGGDGAFAGKTIIDCCNPVSIETFEVMGNEHNSLAERIAAAAPGGHVTKAFNLCQAKVWEMEPPEFDGRTLVVPFCGDDAGARSTAAELIRAVGCEPLDLGELRYARHLEPMAAIVISLLFRGHPPHSVFNWISVKS
ncbi:MAG: NAD(P)-binding domain-containing protein [Planctomycetota bacterium]